MKRSIIKRLRLGNTDVSSRIMKGGLSSVTYESQDDEGLQTIGTLKIRLSNLRGQLDGFRTSQSFIQANAFVRTNTQERTSFRQIFSGSISPGGFKFDDSPTVDGRTAEGEALSIEREFVDKMKDIKLSDVYIPSSAFVSFAILTEDGDSTLTRRFVSVENLVYWIWNRLGLRFAGARYALPSGYYYGGTLLQSPAILSSDLTVYDFISDVCGLCNAVWRIDPSPSRMTIIRKQDLLIEKAAEAPLVLTPIKGTLKTFSRRGGWDRISLEYSNLPRDPDPDDARQGITYRAGEKNISSHEVRIASRYPGLDDAPTRNDDVAVLHSEDPGGDVLIRSFGSGQLKQKGLRAGDALLANYDFELYAMAEQQAEYSLIGREDELLDLLPMFYTHWRTTYANPYPYHHTHFVRKAEVDLDERKLKITTIGFERIS